MLVQEEFASVCAGVSSPVVFAAVVSGSWQRPQDKRRRRKPKVSFNAESVFMMGSGVVNDLLGGCYV